MLVQWLEHWSRVGPRVLHIANFLPVNEPSFARTCTGLIKLCPDIPEVMGLNSVEARTFTASWPF